MFAYLGVKLENIFVCQNFKKQRYFRRESNMIQNFMGSPTPLDVPLQTWKQ